MNAFTRCGRGLCVFVCLLVSSPSFAAFQGTLFFHGNPAHNVATGEAGCSGDGFADGIACGGPFLHLNSALANAPPAHYDIVNNTVLGHAGLLSNSTAGNVYSGHWNWKLSQATQISGDVVLKFWVSCKLCTGLADKWFVRFYADGVKAHETLVETNGGLPGTPYPVIARFTLPTLSASTSFTLQLEPNYLDSGTAISYLYDSSNGCVTAAGPVACDSQILFTGTTSGGGGGGSTIPVSVGGPRFDAYTPPSSVTTRGASEPTLGTHIGNNSATMLFQFDAVQARWDDSVSPASVSWKNLGTGGAPASLDPFLTMDQFPLPGGAANPRVWVIQLLGATSYIAFSDNEGATWTNSTGAGQVHGVDNQSVAVGPYPASNRLAVPRSGQYAHAVYYCSHEAVNAFCSRSDDGGLSFGPSRPIFPLESLCNNHGHVKVGADGTVYVPMNNSCEGSEGVTLSVDGGHSWHYIKVPETVRGRWDSSIAIANNGTTLYYGYAEEGVDEPMILRGELNTSNLSKPSINWDTRGAANVGTPYGLKNIVFSTVVAGDPNRAAFAFHGTVTEGDSGNAADAQIKNAAWHLYVATTYDGGASWQVRNATPGDPTQRGSICDRGASCDNTPDDRNLLDFMDMDIDGKGRIVIAMADGCVSAACLSGSTASHNDYVKKGYLLRQADGLGLLSAHDPQTSSDSDNDGVSDDLDNCPFIANSAQTDSDGDGIGDACDAQDDTDTDGDGVRDELDNCPTDANADQEDIDGDGIGDACDPQDDTDTDGDGVRDELDNCPDVANSGQADADGDGIGDACQTQVGSDSDGDGVNDELDNCPFDANPDQQDTDGNGLGDACQGAATANNGTLDAELSISTDSNDPYTVHFDASASHYQEHSGAIHQPRYRFVFGDGQQSSIQTSAQISHSYPAAGDYTAYAVVSDGHGNAASSERVQVTITITISVTDTGANAARLKLSNASGPAPLSVSFDATSSTTAQGYTITGYSWDFDGNGTVDLAGKNGKVQHVYTRAGSYTPSVTVSFSNGSQTVTSIAKAAVNAATPSGGTPTPQAPAAATGGGALGWLLLTPLLGASLARRRRMR